MLTSAFNIQRVVSSGTIYINADGSIDPPTAPIKRRGKTYVFTDDIYDSIVVLKDDIVIDGRGYIVQGSGTGTGMDLSYRSNVTVKRVKITNFWYGIYLYYSQQNYLERNIVMNTVEAISLRFSSYNTLTSNEILDNLYGIQIFSFLGLGIENTLKRNVMAGNKYNFGVSGDSLTDYIHDIDTSNTVDGKPIYYWINRQNETIPLNAGYVTVVNSSGVTVKNLELKNNVYGVNLAYTRNSLIENVTVIETVLGISLRRSDYNVITGNNVSASNGGGILVDSSTRNNVTYNLVTNTNGSGIWLEDSIDITVIGNSVSYSRQYQPQEYDGAGILVDDTRRSEIVGNNVTKNKWGIVVGSDIARFNFITRNNMVRNEVGIVFSAVFVGGYNTVYNNNFIENQLEQVRVDGDSANTFNNGYPEGGNYWSDYNGTDLFSGPDQDQPGSDGIGDIPYIIDENNIDRYPLVNPWPSHDVATIDIIAYKTITGQGYPILINVTVVNQGDFDEAELNVTLFADPNLTGTKNEIQIDLQNITLTIRETKSIQFLWNTTNVPYGEYIIIANITTVPSEIDAADNTLINGVVMVTSPGDVNGDRTVDIFDIGMISAHWYPGPPIGPLGYDTNADINNDGAVDIFDIGITSAHWNQT